MSCPAVVLFDLGGVLVRFGGAEAMARLAAIEHPEVFWRRWLSSAWVRDFERGRCTAGDFARGMVEEWSLSVEPAEFLSQFRGWPRGLLPGARELVMEVRRETPVGCLSNISELHWREHAPRWRVQDLFDWSFLSHQVGMIKPDREFFVYTVEQLGCSPGEIIFVDDNEVNVTAAQSVGLRAHRAAGVAEARSILRPWLPL